MSAPEPLRLTLEEALRLVDKHLDEVRAEDPLDDVDMGISPDGGWFVLSAQGFERVGTWPEAASKALGVPVVERDDRAQLIEALRHIAGMEVPVDYGGPPIDYYVRHREMAEYAEAALAKAKGEA